MLRFATADKNVMKTAQHKEVYHTVAHLQFTENELEKEKKIVKPSVIHLLTQPFVCLE